MLVRRFFPLNMNGEVLTVTRRWRPLLPPAWVHGILGYSFESSGSYFVGLILMGVALIMGGVLMAILPAYPKRTDSEATCGGLILCALFPQPARR